MKLFKFILMGTLVAGLLATYRNAAPVQAQDEFIFGIILVGPHDDRGWSQAHYEAGLYVEEQIPGAKMIYVENVNAGNPDVAFDAAVDEMVSQGAQLIIANSDDHRQDVHLTAPLYPDVKFLHISGDGVLTGEAPENVTNIMGRMEYGKMIAGCAAALTTQTGKISYLGPLINDETRRLTASAYLGAKYCYETYRGESDLEFEVIWIGFWFEIPGVTLNPTEVTNDFYNSGADVVISGIDTANAITVAGQRFRQGEQVYAIPYDYEGACEIAAEACLGVPFFNWRPAYINLIQSILDDEFEPSWDWNAPDWEDINNLETTAVGFEKGDALPEEASAQLDEFIAGLAAGANGEEDGLVLWQGPLNLQDGTEYLAEGEIATDEQIWYLPQLLEGMEGASTSE